MDKLKHPRRAAGIIRIDQDQDPDAPGALVLPTDISKAHWEKFRRAKARANTMRKLSQKATSLAGNFAPPRLNTPKPATVVDFPDIYRSSTDEPTDNLPVKEGQLVDLIEYRIAKLDRFTPVD